MSTTEQTQTSLPTDRADLADAVAQADLTPLLCAVAHRTGDRSLLRAEWRPDQSRLVEPDAGVEPAAAAEARRVVVERIVEDPAAWTGGDGSRAAPDVGPRAGPASIGGEGDQSVLRAVLAFAAGEDAVEPYLPLLRQELGLGGADLRAPGWRLADVAPGRDLRVAVIGAGMSGIAAAHRLLQAGVGCTVIEKDAGVGGTWLENTYPGCRVDVPNHLYSYSFAQRHDWPQHFSTQRVLLDYFADCAERFGVLPHVRFSTEVVSATWEEEPARWALRLRGADGGEETVHAEVVVSAVGQLNRPHVPAVPGAGTFAGPAFHSARWRHDVDLAGKRVAVIGTGASAAQFVPVLAEEAAELTVFQRTPPWLVPTPDYHDDVAPELRQLFERLAGYAEWYRFWLFWRNAEGLLPAVRVEDGWDGGGRSVGALNDVLRQLLTAYLEAEFGEDPDLLARVVPTYPPAAKRIIRDNGAWARALRLPHVSLVTEAIDHIGPSAVTTSDGAEHPADVLVYGTGFQASEFLSPMRVVGRDGVELHQRWNGDARAYLGMTVPGFPNLFCLYGPNTNIVINGSIIYFSECGIGYLLEALRRLLESGARWLDCRPEVHEAYNAEIDAANARTAWGASTVHSWYRNAHGRSAQNWPGTLLEYWQRTRALAADDYAWG